MMRKFAMRGRSALAPENTIAAFDAAVTRGEGFSFDLRMLADGTLVAMADNTFDRTTNISGPLSSGSYADVRRADAGAWFAPTFRFERIPELADIIAFMNRCSGNGLALVHPDGDKIVPAIAAAAEELKAGRLVLSSYSPSLIAEIDRAHLSIPLALWAGPDWKEGVAECGGVLQSGGALSAVILPAEVLREEDAHEIEAMGLELYLVGDDTQKAEKLGAKGIVSE